MRLLWFQLVDRQGASLSRTDSLQETSSVDEFLKAAYSQGPAAVEKGGSLGSCGLDEGCPAVIEVPRVWFQLVNTDGVVIVGTDWVTLSEESTIEMLTMFVQRKYDGSYLNGILVPNLTVYKDSMMESPLDIYEEIGSAGREKRTALWVKEQRLTSVWCPEDSISIDLRSLEAIDNYKRIGERIAKDKGRDLSIVLNAITSVLSSKGDPRFIVLENSSGTGKTQMAFNLQTSGSCDVFYLPCAKDAQLVYKAFSKRTVAFLDCINEAAEKLNEGSVAEFYGAKELRLSRSTSEMLEKTPWCVVIPLLPSTIVLDDEHSGDGDGRVSKAMLLTQLEWILQHSRPLFAILARQYMTENGNFGTTPADRIRYLSDMTAKLARVIRSLKERGRPNEFFYRVADTCTNLIDSHFGCLEESEPFDLNLGSCGLLKDEENWKCSGKFPQLESDMLLHLILMGDHEMEEG
ncbi:hypothetical protein F444_18988 [Phytophthora nicotianae P1976]|uniref:Uncharacterized protein n=1 Tax=Phytophthora nicotianae P1976 TaxID=1317066 RepID=A0A080Z9G3_PHYNI|nr:hypothetical protein F444_18988 [Phytophthora nicotianae P1976]